MKDDIVQVGDPILRKHAEAVGKKEFGSRSLRLLISRMGKALHHEEFGVAIAAPQVGVSLRLFLVAGKAFIDPEQEEEEESKKVSVPKDMVFINPQIIRTSRSKREMSEGCLSVRGKYGTVLRHEKATVRAYDEKGTQFTYHGSGLLAHIFQHEIDHLDGILYTDKALRLEDESEREALREAFPPGEKGEEA